MRKTVQTIATAMMSVLVAFTVFASMSVHKPLDHPNTPTLEESYLATGDCWTGGEGHPYPTQAVVIDATGANLITDQKGVDAAVNQVFGKGHPYKGIVGFCK